MNDAACRYVQDRLLEMQFLKADAGQDPAIVSHLEQCPACRRFLNEAVRDHEDLVRYATGLDRFITDFQAQVAQTAARAPAGTRLQTAIQVAAVLLLAAGLGGAWLRLMRAAPDVRPGARSVPSADPGQARLEEERRLAWRLRTTADVNGLIHLLETGLGPSQVLAAGYLAGLHATEAVPMLQRLADAWTGDADANPFALALERLPRTGPPSEPLEVPSPEPSPASWSIDIQVTDQETGLPIPGACVRVCTDQSQDVPCDANGRSRVELGQALPESMELQAMAPGYVALCSYLADVNDQTLSSPFAFGLERGVRIGGLVQDVNGMPVQGAIVNVSYHPEYGPKPHVQILFEGPTNAAGQWSCDQIPRDVEQRAEGGDFTFQVRHDDYATCYGQCDPAFMKALTDLSHRVVLHAGSTLNGRVCNDQGEPVEGARVSSTGVRQACTTGPAGTDLAPPPVFDTPRALRVFSNMA